MRADVNLKRSKKIAAALGKIPCEGVVKNVLVLDVVTLQWKCTDVGWVDGVIVAVDTGIQGMREWDFKGQACLVPGWIDAHVHVESSLLTPSAFEAMVLPKGTTTAICDPHELTNVCGTPALEYFLSESEKLAMDLRVMLSSCVPATHMETNGGGHVLAQDLKRWIHHPKVLGLAEVMNVPGVLNQDAELFEKLDLFQLNSEENELGSRTRFLVDGHAPLLRGRELSAYASVGISSCHESSQIEEAREKLEKGMSVWIREGSVAKDLQELIPLLTVASSVGIGFCTDDRNPLDIEKEGHLDHLLRQAIRSGIPPEVVFRSASWTVAQHYGLKDRGRIAPGCLADFVILADQKMSGILKVFKNGSCITEEPVSQLAPTRKFMDTVQASVPESSQLQGPQGRVHVIHVQPGKIITQRSVQNHDSPGVSRLSVLERHGKGHPPANAYVMGFGAHMKGAIASSVGHDSHNLIVVGSCPEEMRFALSVLIQSGGGFCVVQNQSVMAHLALPVGGLMSDANPSEITQKLIALREASRQIGCELEEPFLQLAFLSLPVIPSLKLTDLGLVDVEQFKLISVSA